MDGRDHCLGNVFTVMEVFVTFLETTPGNIGRLGHLKGGGRRVRSAKFREGYLNIHNPQGVGVGNKRIAHTGNIYDAPL